MVRKKRGGARRNSRTLPSPNTWVVLSVAVLVIGLTVITALGPSSVTGNTVQNIAKMNKGDPLQLAVRDVPGLETVFTNADESILYGKITVEADESIPFDRLYLSKFTISSDNKFGPLRFTFKFKEQDLLAKGISRDDLRLYHGLQEYSLELLKVNFGNLYYIVTVPSMGNFVLGRVEEKVEEKPAEAEVEEQASVVEEQLSEEAVEETPEEEPLAGKAVEVSAPASEKVSLWVRIAAFFRNLFS